MWRIYYFFSLFHTSFLLHMVKIGVKGGNKRGGASMSGSPPDSSTAPPLECLICAASIDICGVFDCGHFCCAICALRVQKFMKSQGCPICRKQPEHVIVVDDAPDEEHSFDLVALKAKYPKMLTNRALGCRCSKLEIMERLEKLCAFLCPVRECWVDGEQEPFSHLSMLKEHLSVDHNKLKYCSICLEHRPAFFCEQIVYTETELDNHHRAKCRKDSPSFQGHPLCLFCSIRYYDTDALIKHMQHTHFTCDVCNRGEFIFTYYRNRNKLIEHLSVEHKLCNHQDCSHLDPMLRVFASDIELQAHAQRVHGAAKANVSLHALGFQFSAAPGYRPRGTNTSTASPGLVSNNPSTGSEAHATKVYFDNVTHKQELDLTPTTAKQTSANSSSKNTSSPGSYASIALAARITSCNCIPDYYEAKALRKSLKPILMPASKNASFTNNNHNAATSNGGDGGKGNSSPTKEEGGGRENQKTTSSGGMGKRQVSDPSYVPEELFNFKRSPKEYDAILKEKLAHHFTTRSQFENFREVSVDFLNNKLLATAYYDQLATVFFPVASTLTDVIESLIGSLRNETKKEALIAARKMMTCREVKKRQEAEREEEHKQMLLLQQQQSGKKSGGVLGLKTAAAQLPTKNMWEKRKIANEAAAGNGMDTTGSPNSHQHKKHNPGHQSTGGKNEKGGMEDSPSKTDRVNNTTTNMNLARADATRTWGGNEKKVEHFDPMEFPSLGVSGGEHLFHQVKIEKNKKGGGAGNLGVAPVAPVRGVWKKHVPPSGPSSQDLGGGISFTKNNSKVR